MQRVVGSNLDGRWIALVDDEIREIEGHIGAIGNSRTPRDRVWSEPAQRLAKLIAVVREIEIPQAGGGVNGGAIGGRERGEMPKRGVAHMGEVAESDVDVVKNVGDVMRRSDG